MNFIYYVFPHPLLTSSHYLLLPINPCTFLVSFLQCQFMPRALFFLALSCEPAESHNCVFFCLWMCFANHVFNQAENSLRSTLLLSLSAEFSAHAKWHRPQLHGLPCVVLWVYWSSQEESCCCNHQYLSQSKNCLTSIEKSVTKWVIRHW